MFIIFITAKELKKFMAAFDNLTQAITDLTAAVDKLPTTPATGGATEAQVQAAADAVNVQTARIVASVTPPPVP